MREVEGRHIRLGDTVERSKSEGEITKDWSEKDVRVIRSRRWTEVCVFSSWTRVGHRVARVPTLNYPEYDAQGTRYSGSV